MPRSCVNWVAHEVVEYMTHQPTWTDLRKALDLARIAVETCDLYRDLYVEPIRRRGAL
jgi:hypothetical protein